MARLLLLSSFILSSSLASSKWTERTNLILLTDRDVLLSAITTGEFESNLPPSVCIKSIDSVSKLTEETFHKYRFRVTGCTFDTASTTTTGLCEIGQCQSAERFEVDVLNSVEDQKLFVTDIVQRISRKERQLIDFWIKRKNLNKFGDPINHAYIGGTPLFNERTGKTERSRYAYIIEKHGDKRPWELKWYQKLYLKLRGRYPPSREK